jgi:DNA-binding NtrC family response regulator
MPNPIKNGSILMVDDAMETLEILQRNLMARKYQVFTAAGVTEALRLLEATPIDLVITDLKMPKISGLELIKHIRDNYKNMEVIMITGYASINGAIEAVQSGAEAYLPKPFTDEELFTAVERAFEKIHRRQLGELAQYYPFVGKQGLIGESEIIKKIFKDITKAAQIPATVLLTGESGTGKELVARAIHYSSQRASAPFVPVNCGGIPENLLESELFGFTKGAFTGAHESRAGFFQTADGGTIFLDEISNTSLTMQAKLLRVLQDKEVNMVGSTRLQKVDLRILSATNKDLYTLVRQGFFREDLYYRINVIKIELPPLRERGDDILLLAHHFLNKFALDYGKPVPKFTDRALAVLKKYHWPGNIRELENVIQSIMVMSDCTTIDVGDFPIPMHSSFLGGYDVNRTLAEAEIEHIRNVLNSVDGNKTRAAQILGIDRKTLRDKIQKYPHKF